MKNKSVVTRTSKEFEKEIWEIQNKRLLSGKDKLPRITATPRITLAMTRHDLFKKIKQDIIDADLKWIL